MGNLITTLKGHNWEVWKLRLSLDNKALFSAGFDHAILIWDLRHPVSPISSLLEHRGFIHTLDTSDKYGLISGCADRTIKVKFNLILDLELNIYLTKFY